MRLSEFIKDDVLVMGNGTGAIPELIDQIVVPTNTTGIVAISKYPYKEQTLLKTTEQVSTGNIVTWHGKTYIATKKGFWIDAYYLKFKSKETSSNIFILGLGIGFLILLSQSD